MKSGQDRKTTAGPEYENSPRLILSNPSARLALVILFLCSLNAVACYDSMLSGAVKGIGWIRRLVAAVSSMLTSLARMIWLRNPFR
jgi:hypothetical protein